MFFSEYSYCAAELPEIKKIDYQNKELMKMRKEITENIYLYKNKKELNIQFRVYKIKKGDEFFKIVARSMLDAGTVASLNSILYFDELTMGERWLLPNMRGIAQKGNPEDLAEKHKLHIDNIFPIPGKKEWYFIPQLNNSIINSIIKKKWFSPLSGKITSGFGYRRHPFTGKKQFHTGIDIAAPRGSNVKATRAGKIITAKFIRGYGKTVLIEHKNGYQSLYAHLSRINVKKGQSIRANTIIGNVGTTGNSTGPHLHFEIRKNNVPVSPISYVR